MTETPETLSKRSVLYRLAHDEWCSHDEADDGIPCDCHLSMIAHLRKRLEAAEHALDCIRTLSKDEYASNEASAALAGEETK